MKKPRAREKVLEGNTYKMRAGCGNIYITFNSDSKGLFEIFAHLGKSGQCGAAQLEMASRVISAGLRAGINPSVFVKQLKGIKCPSPIWDNGEQILSCADAIGRALEMEIERRRK